MFGVNYPRGGNDCHISNTRPPLLHSEKKAIIAGKYYSKGVRGDVTLEGSGLMLHTRR